MVLDAVVGSGPIVVMRVDFPELSTAVDVSKSSVRVGLGRESVGVDCCKSALELPRYTCRSIEVCSMAEPAGRLELGLPNVEDDVLLETTVVLI